MREYTEQSQSPRECGVHTHGWDFLRSMPTVAFHTISKPLQVPQQRLAVQFQQEAPEDPRLCQRFHRPQQMSQARVPKSLCWFSGPLGMKTVSLAWTEHRVVPGFCTEGLYNPGCCLFLSQSRAP